MIHVTRLNVFEAISDIGDPRVWATLEWGGIIRKSRPIPKPQLQEMFYFKLGVTDDQLTGDKSDLTDQLMEELRTKPEVLINVWASSNN